ncbi:MAG TPA: alpha/beta hydrolase-fold protein [Phycisphaerae bacterium]|nr:alpha/beta hydrolase-fold protein [Phycisphaerae bacterium]
MTRRLALLLLLLCWSAPASAEPTPAKPLEFAVQFDPAVRSTPFTGRIILFLSDKLSGEPRASHSWLSRQPVFGQEVRDWKPGEVLHITNPDGFPFPLRELPKGRYAIQAVLHTNPDVPHSGTAEGNLYSKPAKRKLDPATSGVVPLRINQIVASRKSEMNLPLAKELRLKSKLLSSFHGRDIFLRAVVVLPEVYEKEPQRRFNAIYVIPGFGADHRGAAMYAQVLGISKEPFVRIGLDGVCPLGHHVYADSDNNGPWGAALVEELIPHLEKEFRLIPEPKARLLTGHSSGGWSSLWLQITYPDYFGGVWSTSPDSVNFHDFSGIDLYDPASNFFNDAKGQPRPIMREDGKVRLLLKDFARMEDVIGPGGQLHSFEAVFGPRGKDGRPLRLWDRKTGKIDADVVRAWRRFDIVDKLQREWPTVGPRLAGKITVIMGEEDNFYLEGATQRLKEALAKLGSDARVFMEPGKDHGTILFSPPFRAMLREMSNCVALPETQPARRQTP